MRLKEAESRPRAKAMRKSLTRSETILWTRLRCKQLGDAKFAGSTRRCPTSLISRALRRASSSSVDGATHSTQEERAHDRRRDEALAREGWRTLRISVLDIYNDLEGTLDMIRRHLGCASSVPDCVRDTSPARGGGGLSDLEE
jgi:very-short-patch-repair endonuclease